MLLLCLRYFATHGFCFGRVTSCIVGVIVPYERRLLYDGAAFKEKDDAEGSTRCVGGPPASGGWCRACGGRVPECCSGQAVVGLKVIAMPFMQ
jgi:hypothetical protein